MAAELKNITRLARVIANRAADESRRPIAIDFGEITGTKALKTNAFRVPIPASAYSICTGALERVSRGSRVLVVWIGSDAVVVDTIQSGTAIP